MTALERLLAEAIPTGTFGDPPTEPRHTARPARRPSPEAAGYTVRDPVSPEQAAANQRALLKAIDGWVFEDDADERHLRAVPAQEAA